MLCFKMEIIKEKDVNLDYIAKLLKKGSVLVFPTDTVYGIICDANNKKAVDRLFKIKKRDRKNPIPIFVKDIKMAKELAKISKEQEEFLKIAWPGKITVILRRKNGVKLYGVDKNTIALRVPRYKFIKSLFTKINFPISGTSANLSGKELNINIKEIINQLKDEDNLPDLIIDGEKLNKRKSSTIFDLTVKPYKILRR